MSPFFHSQTPPPQTSGLFVDVEGTLIKAGRLNQNLYQDMLIAQKHGVDVTIFTMGPVAGLRNGLKRLGVATEQFAVKNKSDFRGHIFTDLIVDDLPPHYQGFSAANPFVYDATGNTLHIIVQDLEKHPRLAFKTALKNYIQRQKATTTIQR